MSPGAPRGGAGALGLLLMVTLAACDNRPPLAEEVTPAPVTPELPLYEQLYTGEYGPEAERRGDRVRILVWLRALAAREDQLDLLVESSFAVHEGLAELRLHQVKRDQAELAELGPTYERLIIALAAGEPDLAHREEAQAALSLAHTRLGHPEQRRWKLVRRVMARAERWVEGLDVAQRDAMRHALFFLRKPISPGIAPEFYEGLVGAAWRAGDFGSMERVRQGAVDPGSLDIGGLWMINGADETAAVSGLRLQVLSALALAHPGLIPAIEVLLGRRAPLDFSELELRPTTLPVPPMETGAPPAPVPPPPP